MLHKPLCAFLVALAVIASVAQLAAQEPEKKPNVSVGAQAKSGAVANPPECFTVGTDRDDPMSLTFMPAMPSTATAEQNASGPPNALIEPFGVPLAPPIYLVNFLLLYFSNPETAANMPAYKVPLPQQVYQCLFENSEGCPYTDMEQFLAQQALVSGGSQNKNAAWPVSCQTDPKWESLTPPLYRKPDQINQPLGAKSADKIAQLLGIEQDMVLTPDEYACLIGTPPRKPPRDIIYSCALDLTNSNGNTEIPLSSYGLYLMEGDVRSNCAPNAPCLEFNLLFAGPLQAIAKECGFGNKLGRLFTETPILEFIKQGMECQQAWMPSCIAEAPCPGNGTRSNNNCGPSLADSGKTEADSSASEHPAQGSRQKPSIADLVDDNAPKVSSQQDHPQQ